MANVSVIIPTYNRADLVANAIESVLYQTYKDFEIIVADDGSTDNTRTHIEPYMDRITYFFQNNEGKSVATNRAIEKATGKWIAILDSDDVWLPDKLKLQIEALKIVGDGYGLCFTDAQYVNNQYIYGSVFERIGKNLQKEFGRIEEPISYVLAPPHGIYIPTTLIEKRLFGSVGYFDPKLRVGQDTDMIFKVSMKTKFVYVNRILVKINRTSNRKQGNIEIYKKDFQRALTYRQHMYENWLFLGQDLQESLKRVIRTRLGSVHSSWSNYYIYKGSQKKATEELHKAFEISANYKYFVKKLFIQSFPSISIRLFEKKVGKGKHIV
jgi:glycosyltransferase involved in cell wall biosynthesis